MLVFFLDRTRKSVPAKQYSSDDVEASKKDKKKAKRMFMGGYLPDDIVLPDLDEFDLGDGPLANQVKNMSNSSVIYYDDKSDKEEGKLTIEDLGDEKYSAERIRRLLQRGLSPKEGWYYLKGMAVIGRNRFTILSEDLADHFGDTFGDTIDNGRDARLRRYIKSREKGIVESTALWLDRWLGSSYDGDGQRSYRAAQTGDGWMIGIEAGKKSLSARLS